MQSYNLSSQFTKQFYILILFKTINLLLLLKFYNIQISCIFQELFSKGIFFTGFVLEYFVHYVGIVLNFVRSYSFPASLSQKHKIFYKIENASAWGHYILKVILIYYLTSIHNIDNTF